MNLLLHQGVAQSHQFCQLRGGLTGTGGADPSGGADSLRSVSSASWRPSGSNPLTACLPIHTADTPYKNPPRCPSRSASPFYKINSENSAILSQTLFRPIFSYTLFAPPLLRVFTINTCQFRDPSLLLSLSRKAWPSSAAQRFV